MASLAALRGLEARDASDEARRVAEKQAACQPTLAIIDAAAAEAAILEAEHTPWIKQVLAAIESAQLEKFPALYPQARNAQRHLEDALNLMETARREARQVHETVNGLTVGHHQFWRFAEYIAGFAPLVTAAPAGIRNEIAWAKEELRRVAAKAEGAALGSPPTVQLAKEITRPRQAESIA
jgi:hypothetical protein